MLQYVTMNCVFIKRRKTTVYHSQCCSSASDHNTLYFIAREKMLMQDRFSMNGKSLHFFITDRIAIQKTLFQPSTSNGKTDFLTQYAIFSKNKLSASAANIAYERF